MKTSNQAEKSRWGALIALMLVMSIGGGTLISCKNNAINDLSPQDSQVFITNYDRTVNFGQYRTFSLPDSVLVEANDRVQTSGTPTELRFITNVANALTSRGYTRVTGNQKPDLGVAVIRVNDTYTGVASNPYSSSYLYNSWYGGYGGFGGYYPYYPSYYTYQVSDNYWSLQMVDLKNAPVTTGGTTTTDSTQLNVIYDAQIRGSNIFDDNSVDNSVNAIFSQSPYLKVSQ